MVTKTEQAPSGDLFAETGFWPDAEIIAGVDEAGRGPLAGPVCAAAVVLDPEQPIAGLADSKKLSAKKREALEPVIKAKARAWAVAWGSVAEIDEINILQATLLAMRRAVEGLGVKPDLVLERPCRNDRQGRRKGARHFGGFDTCQDGARPSDEGSC